MLSKALKLLSSCFIKEKVAFSSFDDLKDAVDKLAGGGYKNLDRLTIGNLLFDITEKHRVFSHRVEVGQKFYRGRVISGFSLAESTSELLSPKAELITRYGRCNSPNQSVLYISSNTNTVLSELDIQKNQLVQIIELEAKEAFSLLVIGEVDHFRRYGNSMFSSKEEQYLEMLKGTTNDEDLSLVLVDAFLAELFLSDENKQSYYRYTSTAAAVFFVACQLLNNRNDNNSHTIGFSYPSVSHRGGINYAIDTEWEGKFFIKQAKAILIESCLNYNIYREKNFAKSSNIFANGDIDWKISDDFIDSYKKGYFNNFNL